eukprot:Nitzschia sp. Nitz4//scaffold170_size48074//266//3013//NITZ4_007098-RA/size48074-processed-gene-0.17-mRNA-1//-1//CDS//3329538619//8566//frame0
MLVNLSPWKSVQTSLTSRRRKRTGKGSEDDAFQAVFVTASSRRGQSKKKSGGSDLTEKYPFLSITSSHQVMVVGRSKDRSYSEMTSMQYQSRPGVAGSFFPTQTNRKSASNAQIPAVIDTKTDRVFALQQGNKRLCVWGAHDASGPSSKHLAVVELSSPAVSLSLLPVHKGVVYGSCLDGSLFVAKASVDESSSESTISVDYLPVNAFSSDMSHVRTVAVVPKSSAKTPGRKRKMSDAEGLTSILFYQSYCLDGALTLIRHQLSFNPSGSGTPMVVASTHEEQVTSMQLASTTGESLSDVKLMVSPGLVSTTFVVGYSLENKGTRESYSVMLDPQTGTSSHVRVKLPSTSTQYGLVAESTMAVATPEYVILYDLASGAPLENFPLPDEVAGMDGHWRLCTNVKNGTIAFLYTQGDKLSVSFSQFLMDQSQDVLPSAKVSLASRLASAVQIAPAAFDVETAFTVQTPQSLLPIPSKKKQKMSSMRDIIESVVKDMEDARLRIVGTEKEVPDFLFMDTYEQSVGTIVSALKNEKIHNTGKGAQNPQDDDDVCANGHGDTNGTKSPMKQKNGVNGTRKTKLPTPAMLPQQFVEGVLEVVLNLLQAGQVEDPLLGRRVALARLDARTILGRLLRTGKVSARLQLEDAEDEGGDESKLTKVLRSVKLTNKRGRRCFTPVDMIQVMLHKCPDVSERQMVSMLSYMLRRALPEDCAEALLEDRNAQGSHLAARDFFAVRTALAKSSSSKEDTEKEAEMKKLSDQLLLSGTTLVLKRILRYSLVNEAMLRTALRDTLKGNEVQILSKLLVSVLSTTSVDATSKYSSKHSLVESTCQWMSALCDTFQEEMTSYQTTKGTSFPKVLYETTRKLRKQTQAIVSLKNDIRRFDAEMDKVQEEKKAALVIKVHNSEELPGYSIDRLIL